MARRGRSTNRTLRHKGNVWREQRPQLPRSPSQPRTPARKAGVLDSGLEAQTALFITFDEGGGYYDSGFIQPIDFFGDGPRVPLVVVSPYSKGGHVAHSYADHVSILKFIERNWRLEPLSARSRDNLPNPFGD
jgi:phospholipase C